MRPSYWKNLSNCRLSIWSTCLLIAHFDFNMEIALQYLVDFQKKRCV